MVRSGLCDSSPETHNTQDKRRQSASSAGYAGRKRNGAAKMSELTKRKLIDFAITGAVAFVLAANTDNAWIPLVVFPYSVWNFYDGMTRRDLKA
jgi:hypothetical protein